MRQIVSHIFGKTVGYGYVVEAASVRGRRLLFGKLGSGTI